MADDFTFAVIADSHFHPPGSDAQSAYPSDRVHNARNAAVVARLNRARPAFVVHLGDIPHPIPGLGSHQVALDEASRVYRDLDAPLYAVPGNHDVGDKPHPMAPARPRNAAAYRQFEDRWGPPWQSFTHGDCGFVLIDTPVLNTTTEAKARQWVWLEETLRQLRGRRVFAFVHYPPFLYDPDEPEHYDNLAEPARRRLLDLLAEHGTVALFAGHVHHFFYDRYRDMDLVIAPSTSFVRPGYAELAPVRPVDEHGRNDAGRLGYLLVQVGPGRHRYEPVRTDGAAEAPARSPLLDTPAPCPVGMTFRHPWAAPVELPADNLEPYQRKRVRNDLAVWAAWDLGLQLVRLPLQDLLDASTRRRLRALQAGGLRFAFFVAGVPDRDTWRQVIDHRDLIAAVEVIGRRPLDPTALDHLGDDGPPIWVSVTGPLNPGHDSAGLDEAYFSHFSRTGFDLDGPLDTVPPSASAVVYHIGPQTSPWDGIARANAREPDRPAVCEVWLPRADEGVAFDDDRAIACRIAQTWVAALAHPDATVHLDTFVDHDRGYYPRHGLLDRRMDPRPAYRVLCNLSRLFGSAGTARRDSIEGVYRIDGARARGALVVPAGADASPILPSGTVIDLVTGESITGPTRPGWPVATVDPAKPDT